MRMKLYEILAAVEFRHTEILKLFLPDIQPRHP